MTTSRSRSLPARRLAALAVALAALAPAAPAAAAGSRTYRNTLSVLFRSGPAGDQFRGRVHSARRDCLGGRRIAIFRKRPGADLRLGSTRSREGGHWRIDPPGGTVAPGRYYAVMRRKVLERGGGEVKQCAAVQTPALRVTR
ncbi:MAG: hypothetical protein U0R52_05545 [Solirubrobacterales bacterium]